MTASTSRDYVDYVSLQSDLQSVATTTAAVDVIELDGVSVSCVSGVLEISARADIAWNVYTPAGVRVATGVGSSTLSLDRGVYLVNVGSRTLKFSVR